MYPISPPQAACLKRAPGSFMMIPVSSQRNSMVGFFIVYQVLISVRGSGEITLASPESSQHSYLKIFMLITYSALKSH